MYVIFLYICAYVYTHAPVKNEITEDWTL